MAAARDAGRRARVHLKIDTGLSRNGAYVDDWPDLVAAAVKAETGGEIAAVGVWSHFAYADDPGHPTVARQLDRFREGVALAERSGLRPQVRHLANSAATVTNPEAHFDLVRPGIAIYGLSPVPTHGNFDLVPAMSLRAEVALVKRVQSGEGVSYGHIYHTAAATTLVLVPLGYADGIPRHAGNRAPVQIAGARFRISGRVCMDQFVVDVGDQAVAAGDPVVLFGSGHDGEPTAQDWAEAAETIHYEIVTRVGPRVPRRYVGSRRMKLRTGLIGGALGLVATTAAVAVAVDRAAAAPPSRRGQRRRREIRGSAGRSERGDRRRRRRRAVLRRGRAARRAVDGGVRPRVRAQPAKFLLPAARDRRRAR